MKTTKNKFKVEKIENGYIISRILDRSQPFQPTYVKTDEEVNEYVMRVIGHSFPQVPHNCSEKTFEVTVVID